MIRCCFGVCVLLLVCVCVKLTPATVFFFHPQSPYLIIIISSTLLLFLHVSSTHSLALCFPLSRSINKRVVIINNWPGITVTPFDSTRWMPSWEWWVCMCECERKQKKREAKRNTRFEFHLIICVISKKQCVQCCSRNACNRCVFWKTESGSPFSITYTNKYRNLKFLFELPFVCFWAFWICLVLSFSLSHLTQNFPTVCHFHTALPCTTALGCPLCRSF